MGPRNLWEFETEVPHACSCLVEAITGTNLTIRPAKIVAGHEPSKTNELLQAIGKALDRKVRVISQGN
jgi:hypothetical protein